MNGLSGSVVRLVGGRGDEEREGEAEHDSDAGACSKGRAALPHGRARQADESWYSACAARKVRVLWRGRVLVGLSGQSR